ncbi:putative multiple rna-binding domain-containing protein 1 protein [Botrytis fragariae]|uniref:Multiple RNA-binding domain-containing protein 1 n=1 Tax=Botrytis fragariae TaxID=1964551 RepID=A0A8H6AQR3_9HELO|nr:putative multiple rna-binding domain-containing protein 1 protein [Botrytis fragariae]KAF5871759.1 putative multiple rna-binding domain-containing protein 1 protein [Botrytis fragariae]
MASSRIFIKGLPPNITEDEFKTHFGAKQEITDAKLISHRRIGYIGYKTPEEAAKAVKYFNKSFVRMSKIGVEIARPISDASLPVSRKAQREQERENNKLRQLKQEADAKVSESLNTGTKRKRSDVDVADPKLQEFLEVMQPASKSNANMWKAGTMDADMEEPPTKLQAIEVPEEESDDEYQSVPSKAKKAPANAIESKAPVAPIPSTIVADSANQADEAMVDAPSNDVEATDDDWLRSHTNRLLDIVDPEDIIPKTQNLNVKDVEEVAAGETEPNTTVEATVVDEAQVVEEQTENSPSELDATLETIKASGRLFVRNLPYSATEDDLRKHFEQYGTLEEIHLPVDAKGASKGFVLVQYTDPNAAAEAYHNVDGEPFQGRLLHILPAAAKRDNKLDEFAIAKLPLKKQRLLKKKADSSSSTFNWNSLYMNQDAVNSSVAERLGVSKSELLDPTSADAGVKQAIAETSVIQETKSYFANNGVDLDAFKKRERGDTAILVKNFTYGMTLEELRKMFEEFGQVIRVLMPPTGTIAIVEFAQPTHARAAFASLAYRRMKDTVLFLEKAPKDLFTGPPPAQPVATINRNADNAADPKLSTSDLLERDSGVENVDTTTLFVRNLNFSTTSQRLTEIFKPLDGFLSARVNTKTDPKKPGQVLSMGFGFIEFRTKSQAQAAIKAMDGYTLDNHKLLVKASHKGADAAEEKRKEDRAKKLAGKRTKLIVKNLPFEASKSDIRKLFGTYGQLRSVRMPKKFDHSTRGFAFADFITAREAENALEALKDTHLLGRRLVIDFASEETVDAEEEIEKMQKKVGSQVNKVALQNLTGGGRKKFNIEGNDADLD